MPQISLTQDEKEWLMKVISKVPTNTYQQAEYFKRIYFKVKKLDVEQENQLSLTQNEILWIRSVLARTATPTLQEQDYFRSVFKKLQNAEGM